MTRINFLFMILVMSVQHSQAQVKALGIGDRLPPFSFDNIMNYSRSVISSKDLKGKNIIIDFWASWCTPCIKQFPILDSFQQAFNKNLQIIAVTNETREFTEINYKRIKEQTGMKLSPTIYNDTTFSKMFPHRTIPHYVWIDKEGIIRAITGAGEVSHRNIKSFLGGSELKNVAVKVELPADDTLNYEVPPLKSGQVKTDVIRYNSPLGYLSLFGKYVPGFGSEVCYRPTYNCGINVPIINLYKFVFIFLKRDEGWALFDNNRFILEGFNGRDSLRFGYRTSKTEATWQLNPNENCYNYELSFDDTVSDLLKARYMLQDINRIFSTYQGYEANLEKRSVKWLRLIRTSAMDKVSSRGGRPMENWNDKRIAVRNIQVQDFVEKLQPYCYTAGANLPIRDMTGLQGNFLIDIDLNIPQPTLENFNKALMAYDLKLELDDDDEPIDMVVVKKLK